MKFLHSMVRVKDLEASLAFFRDALGLIENKRRDYPDGRFTLVYLGAPENPEVEVELTFNYDTEDYGSARNFGHLAFEWMISMRLANAYRMPASSSIARHAMAGWRLCVHPI